MKVVEFLMLSGQEYRNKAFATVEMDGGRMLRGLQVIDGGSDRWFVAIPRRLGDAAFESDVDPTTRAQIESVVLGEFHRLRSSAGHPDRPVA